MVLTDLLLKTQHYFKFKKLGICYINHHLRTDVEEDITFIQSFAEKKGIRNVYIESIFPEEQVEKKKLSLEESARILRYQKLKEITTREKYDFIATAHHKSDVAETILMRLMEGTGLKGLTGIRLKFGSIIRPLLYFSREEIEQYALKEQLSFRNDYTNTDLHFKRNKIRHELLPLIKKEFNPRIEDALWKLAMNVQEWIENIEQKYPIPIKKPYPSVAILSKSEFLTLNHSIQKWVLEKLIEELSGTPFFFTYHKWKRMINDLNSTSKNLKIKNNIFLGLEKKEIWLYQAQQSYQYILKENDVFKLPFGIKLSVSKAPESNLINRSIAMMKEDFKTRKPFQKIWVCKSNIQPLFVESCNNSLQFQPIGLNYKVKVKRFLREKGVPLALRDIWPIIVTREHEVVAIPGFMPAEDYKIKDSCVDILEFRIFNYENFFV